jgi:YrbI family 3-deoxy-D-manno-octulosonate 8-phosphate phosphatase
MNIDDIEVFIFDFDGVLTNNLVYLNQDGLETVACSRADGLAFDVLRELKKPVFILSTELNPVVAMRAKKLQIEVIQGSKNKLESLKKLIVKHKYNKDKICYIGNDVNDYFVMNYCGYSICPADSHSDIKKISNVVLQTKGGYGVVRDLLENVLNLDFIKILYQQKEL